MADEEEDALVRVRTLDGQSLMVAIAASKRVSDLRMLLLDRQWPVLQSSGAPARQFHLVHKSVKLPANTQISSLCLEEQDFIACVPYTVRQQATPLPDTEVTDEQQVGKASTAATDGAGADTERPPHFTGNVSIVQRLERVFAATNAVSGFLQNNGIQLTWKNLSSALQHLSGALVGTDTAVTLKDIADLSVICPQVLTLKTMPAEAGDLCHCIQFSSGEGTNTNCEKRWKQIIARRKKAFGNALGEVVAYLKTQGSSDEITLDALLAAARDLEQQRKPLKLKPELVTFARPMPQKRRRLSSRRVDRRCKDLNELSAFDFVEHLKQCLGSSGQVSAFVVNVWAFAHLLLQIVHCERMKAREGLFGQLEFELSACTREALGKIGVSKLYTHQAVAVNSALSMRSAVVSTSTASGKSLCYNIPVLEALYSNTDCCALYLFPTKALAQDQLRSLLKMTESSLIQMGVYDGDTNQADRRALRDTARILITNPDMLHCSILPYHKQFHRFLSNLRYVVVDEAHAYRGAFGCHTALIIRRLRRICCHLYGTLPTFIVCSATIANPQEHAKELTGLKDITSVQGDGSPCGEKLLVLWNPPLRTCEGDLVADEGTHQKRLSPILEIAHLFAEVVQHGLRCIAFCKTRKLCELVLNYTSDILKDTAPHLLDSIRAYRAGYTPLDRRNIERKLFAGDLRGVASTSALELGIDVGSLDATLHLGFPGSMASFWQQAGRAGRRDKASVSVYVAFDSPLDQHFMKEPAKLLTRTVENAQVDSCNEQVLGAHLSCAAFEYPLHFEHDAEYFGSGLKSALECLIGKGFLGRHPSDGQASGAFHYIGHEKSPSMAFSIRAIDPEKYSIINELEGKVIEEVEASKAFFEVYEGAVYINQGRKYLVKKLDLTRREAFCCPTNVGYYTRTRDFTDVQIVGSELAYPRPLPKYPSTSAHANKCQVTTRWIGFRRIWERTNETFDSVELSLPDVSYESQAAWIPVSQEVRACVESRSLNLRAGLHAASHALLNVMPLYIMCNLSDVGTECAHPQDKRYYAVRLLVFDRCPSGIGISAQAQLFFGELLQAALEQVKSCDCSVNTGCPNCIQYFSCSEYNEVLDKAASIVILQGVIDTENKLRSTPRQE